MEQWTSRKMGCKYNGWLLLIIKRFTKRIGTKKNAKDVFRKEKKQERIYCNKSKI